MNVTLHLGSSVLTVPSSALSLQQSLVKKKEDKKNNFKTGPSDMSPKKRAKQSKTLVGSTAAETLSLGVCPQSSVHSSTSFKKGGFILPLSFIGGNTISP